MRGRVGLRRVLLAATALAALAGCSGPAAQRTRPTPAGTAAPAAAVAGTTAVAGTPYRLYTHCGIREANIGGRWFVAATPLGDGNGNPPPGWGNPYQDGTITVVSPTEAVFADDSGHRVRFLLRPGATAPATICS